jgi:hypothetical protein
VHVGVVHTTPGPRTSDLTPAEKRSIRRLTGSTRKKDISSHEFQRPHQYMQIEAAFDGVRKWAYKWDPKHPEFFGPWILAGDYYLFKESRVVDMETQYGEDQSFGSFAPEIEKELQARLAAYKACGERSDVYKVRSEMWHWRAVDWGRQTYITTHTRNHYAELLRRDDSLVVGEAIQAEPMTRSRLMLHQPRWLAPYPYYNSIDAELFADVLSWRTRMYKDLADHCAFYKGRAAALAEVEKGTIKEKFVALRKDNKVLMERVGAPGGKQAKTEVGMHISGQDDPMRNPLGMTFRGQVDEGALEFAQTISGTNLDKYEGLSKLDRDDAAERYAEFIEARARFVVRLKVADFLVHTKYDPTTNVGATHWTACTVGMLSPDLGKIVLADTADLTISRFWAAFSDHFPVGGVLSTVNREDEAGSIRNSIVREEPGAPLLVEQFELERRKRRAEMLLMLHLIRNLNPQVQDEEIDKELKAYRLKLSEMNKAELTEAIHDLEDRLKVPQVDRFDIDDTPLTATDIGWSGDLIFSFGAPVLHAMDNTEGSSSQASTNF